MDLIKNKDEQLILLIFEEVYQKNYELFRNNYSDFYKIKSIIRKEKINKLLNQNEI